MDRVFLRRAFYRLIHSLHDAAGNRIAEYDYDESLGTSTLIREYIWADGMVVAVVEAGQIYFVRTDHIGRPVFATDDLGAVVWEASYLPFGGVQTSTGANTNLRFPGQWFQSETALHQNWMRDYDPTTGRYIQADPLGLVDGASVYGYALQNPGKYYDPQGEQTKSVVLPGDPTGLGSDWLTDDHPMALLNAPGNRRFKHLCSNVTLMFHAGRPNLSGSQRFNHWHFQENGGYGNRDHPLGQHLMPGATIIVEDCDCENGQTASGAVGLAGGALGLGLLNRLSQGRGRGGRVFPNAPLIFN